MKQVHFLEPMRIDEFGPRYVRHPGPFAISDVDLEKIFPGIQNVNAEPHIGQHIKGDTDPPNLELITRLVKYLEPKVVLEVGTFRGKTAYNMALAAPSNSQVITIALPKDMIRGTVPGYGTDAAYFQDRQEIGTVFKGTPQQNKIRQIYADSRSLDCQQQLDKLLADEIDFTFIDAGHDFEGVKSDFEELVLPRMKRDGVVVFDNYGHLKTQVGVAHYLTSKAYEDGYVFYWYAPVAQNTSCVLFQNNLLSRNRQWR